MKSFTNRIQRTVKSGAYLALAATVLLSVALTGVIAPVEAVSAPTDNYNDQKKYRNDSLIVKLKADTEVQLDSGDNFVAKKSEAATKRKAERINRKLNDVSKRDARKMLEKSANPNKTVQKLEQTMDKYFVVEVAPTDDIAAKIAEMKTAEGVEDVLPVTKPAPSPTVNNYTSQQKYLQDSPNGMGSTFAKTYPGGNGQGVRIIDIEYSWNNSHEDLSRSLWTYVQNGTPLDPFNDNNHGTATIGTLIASDNSIGVTGMLPGAAISRINAYNNERGWDVVGALQRAAQIAVPGDVVLIEQQTWAPSPLDGYVPVEWEPAIYDAIKVLTDSGVNVVQAGGNGGHNLDDPIFGTSFPMGKAHSGSIIVGAGTACNYQMFQRERLYFSNYGNRVELQGHGECVTSTGYGDLESSTSPNGRYTSNFNGTSSASALVAGAVASTSAARKRLTPGRPLTPAEMRYLLVITGTPQNTEPGTSTGKIGPLPNLNRALLVLDQVAPTAPVASVALSNNKPRITWAASTDNVAVKEYHVYRNGWWFPRVLSASSRNFTDTTAVAGTSYTYRVIAVDTNNLKSANSNNVTITSR